MHGFQNEFSRQRKKISHTQQQSNIPMNYSVTRFASGKVFVTNIGILLCRLQSCNLTFFLFIKFYYVWGWLFFCVCKIIHLRFLTQTAIITYKKDETQRTASRCNCVILRRRLTEVTFFAGDKTSGLHVCLQAVQTSESKFCFLS